MDMKVVRDRMRAKWDGELGRQKVTVTWTALAVVGALFLSGTVSAPSAFAAAGDLSTVAGSGEVGFDAGGFAGDGGAATASRLNLPADVTVDDDGSIFIADNFNNRVRKVDASGVITTVAGNGDVDFSGEGGPAEDAGIGAPTGLAFSPSGDLYIAASNRVLKVDSTGIITTFAGTGVGGFSGENVPATEATIDAAGIAFDSSGNLYIAGGQYVRKVSTSGIITTIGGNGGFGPTGDGGPALEASFGFDGPQDVAIDAAGNVFVSDIFGNNVRKIGIDGIINTVAGTELLDQPSGVVVDGAGDVFVTDNNRVSRVDSSGEITTVAGTGEFAFSGDAAGPATEASLAGPQGPAVNDNGDLFFAEPTSHRVRKVESVADSGGTTSTTVEDGGTTSTTVDNGGTTSTTVDNGGTTSTTVDDDKPGDKDDKDGKDGKDKDGKDKDGKDKDGKDTGDPFQGLRDVFRQLFRLIQQLLRAFSF